MNNGRDREVKLDKIAAQEAKIAADEAKLDADKEVEMCESKQ